MTAPEPESREVRTIPIQWALDAGPAPLVNQIAIQTVLDADSGPGEILVTLGYVAPPLLPSSESSSGQLPEGVGPIGVTTVARFTLSRRRAQELADYLARQVSDWDTGSQIVRGGERS